MIQRCNTVLLQLMCIHKNKAVSIETACMICPRSRGGIAFAGADDGTLYLNLIPLPSHVLLPRCKDMKNKIAIDRTTVGIYDLRLLRG